METTATPVTTFSELALGDKFIDIGPGVAARVLQKKSASSAYNLEGGMGEAEGTLVIEGKSFFTTLTKKSPVIKLENL
jgi:hypothetical protein